MNKDKFSVFEGDLYRNLPSKGFGSRVLLREDFANHFRKIKNGKQLVSCLRAGEFAWPGGYTCFFLTSDGEALSFKAVRENLRSVISDIRDKVDSGWRVIGLECMANVDGPIVCAHTNEEIE
jgi:hypothetical protein